jgi:hypothetical protein
MEKGKKRAGTGAATRRRGWRPLAALLWVALALACSAAVHLQLRRETMERAELRLVSMCEERARMLQEQFGVTVNHVHALSILISIFHFEKSPSAIDQVRILAQILLALFSSSPPRCIPTACSRCRGNGVPLGS